MSAFKLDNHPKITSGFTVPDHYFVDLYATITAKITAQEESTVIAIKPKSSHWILAIAAILVLVFLLPLTINELKPDGTSIDTLSIEGYLMNTHPISQFELVDQLTDQDIKELEVDLHLNTNEIEDYLYSQNIDLYSIE
jgi:hypothetical protein